MRKQLCLGRTNTVLTFATANLCRNANYYKQLRVVQEGFLECLLPFPYHHRARHFNMFEFDLGRGNSRRVGDAPKPNATRRTIYGTFRFVGGRLQRETVFGGRLQRETVFRRRLQRLLPLLTRWAPRLERVWMLSETIEKLKKILYFEEVILRLRLYLNVYSVWKIYKLGTISKPWAVSC